MVRISTGMMLFGTTMYAVSGGVSDDFVITGYRYTVTLTFVDVGRKQ